MVKQKADYEFIDVGKDENNGLIMLRVLRMAPCLRMGVIIGLGDLVRIIIMFGFLVSVRTPR